MHVFTRPEKAQRSPTPNDILIGRITAGDLSLKEITEINIYLLTDGWQLYMGARGALMAIILYKNPQLITVAITHRMSVIAKYTGPDQWYLTKNRFSDNNQTVSTQKLFDICNERDV